MDAAIDSVNDSIGEPTRAGRRARLAVDLSRADLVLMDRAMVAALIQKIHELNQERDEALIAAGVCSMTLPEAIEHLKQQIVELDNWDDSGGDPDDAAPGSATPFDEDLGAELLDGETVYGRVPDLRSDRPSLDQLMVDAMPSSSGGIVGLDFQEGVSFLTHSGSFDVAATGSSSGAVGCTDPRVND
jgi:hypothetical protein